MTGSTSRIIHCGLLSLLRKASTTLRRLLYLIFFCAEVSVFMRSRKFDTELFDLDALEQFLDGFRTHHGLEAGGAELLISNTMNECGKKKKKQKKKYKTLHREAWPIATCRLLLLDTHRDFAVAGQENDGSGCVRFPIASCRSRPLGPGMRTSRTTQPGVSACRREQEVAREE